MKRHFLTIGFFAFLCWIIYLADAGKLSVFDWVRHLPGGDKVGHFVLFGTLAWLLNYSLNHRTIGLGSLRLPLGATLVMLFAAAEEISQLWFATRSFDLIDLTADFCGVVLFSLLQWRMLSRWRCTAGAARARRERGRCKWGG